uniref:Uncharacterized protein n=1 Tax=Tanacetum cinerariifolium TaxID=118510 RepID=A0A6L2P4E1_TANCI|nr:hypothetical protein [Tanacetum cinerariifolium]
MGLGSPTLPWAFTWPIWKTKTRTRRIGIRIPQSNVPTSVADEAITKEMHDGLGRAATTAFSLEADQGNEDEESSLDKEDSPKQWRMIEEINEDENVNLVKSIKQWEAHKTAGHRMESDDTEVVEFSTASPQKDDDEITLAERMVNIKKKYAQQVQAQWIIDEARIAQESPAQAKQWVDVQAHIPADKDLGQRMLEEERGSLSIKERSRLLTEFVELKRILNS